jgi:3-dehydroquinate dehydratase/shikimate dehydrogenase
MNIHTATVRTSRLILRPWREDDLEPFAKLNADPCVREFFPSIMSREESDREARLIMKFMQERGWCFWAVEVPNVAKFIGMIGLDTVDFPVHFSSSVEIGWRLAFDHWGHGYATEGARASLQYGFQTLKLNEIVAYTALVNQRSQRVMEKIGMHRSPADDFDFPNVSVDCKVRQQVLYRIKHDEWERFSSGGDQKRGINAQYFG